MRLEYQILAAILLDLLLGDPRWLPHPVKLMGRYAAFLENPLRKSFRSPHMAGVLAVLLVLTVTGLATYAVIMAAGLLHPLFADVVSVIILYTTLAARDLIRHSLNVYHELKSGNLAEARKKVAMLVGRDTDILDETDIVRATVESVAENTVDGVTAPLFFAVLAGPVGAMLYKAVNTLDSTFGYRNERYIEFGWAAARLDDLVNFIPARLTALMIPIAAFFLRLSMLNSFKIIFRDRKKHPSPNSGLSEAAVAGALGVQLGGLNYYFGQPSFRATLGDPIRDLEKRDILKANALMLITLILAVVVFLSVRLIIYP
ncbi:MAG TPA: adenosylcobinamide-phosphate synthase CbiB [Syntrophales bacterium]|nr:adenosylcobinamide-phosphate synthase CbiB [Syntrophales bacterium]